MTNEVLEISQAVCDAGGRAMLVGGCVRDQLFGLTPKDCDLEVYFLEPARLRAVLESFAQVNTVGEHFAVYKLAFYLPAQESDADGNVLENPKSKIQNRFEMDVSIPRRESKSGKGHRGFVITGDPFMTYEEAARRRDFTINAILQDPLTGEIIDPYNGVFDLHQRILRVVAADTFVEDSLRVLRAVQMAARFEMTVEEQTVQLCRSIDLSDLPHERVWGELEKLLLLAARPSIGLQAAFELGVLDQLFPQLRALVQTPIDAFELTKRRLDAAANLTTELPNEKRLTVMLAALSLNFPGNHADEPKALLAFLDGLGVYTINGYDVREQVLKLAREHQKPRDLFQQGEKPSDGDFRRLAQRVNINLLYRLAKADALAHLHPQSQQIAEEWFIERARALSVEEGAPAPLLLGRHLIEAGIQPGKAMGEILRQVYELQLDGSITTLEEAKQAAQKLVKNPS